jgi:competence ComEA-like helix-hairpin-helix protein
MPKHIIESYLSFTKKERTGITVLIVLIAFFILLPFLFPFFINKKNTDAESYEKELELLHVQAADSSTHWIKNKYPKNLYSLDEKGREKKENNQASGELFYFDPNTATTADWKRLGIRDKTIQTIENYVSKGGQFKAPEDIGKIWGLHPDEIERLTPYIRIKETESKINEDRQVFTPRQYTNQSTGLSNPKNSTAIIDVNLADTNMLITLRGIGNKLSNRIIAYRDKLGGFYSVDQVGETFALPDSTFQKIKPRLTISNTTVKQININTATVDEMKAHPYLRYLIANAIVQYRTQHGNFSTVEEIKNIMVVTEDVYKKVAPYLRVK